MENQQTTSLIFFKHFLPSHHPQTALLKYFKPHIIYFLKIVLRITLSLKYRLLQAVLARSNRGCGVGRISIFGFFCCVLGLYNNSIEEMKNVSKLAKDHKRLVLGSTGKFAADLKNKENIDFQNFLRSHSYSFKPQHQAQTQEQKPQENKVHFSLQKANRQLSDYRRTPEKGRPDESHTQNKLLSTHIQKREKLTICKEVGSPPLAFRCKETVKCRPVQPLQRLFQPLQPNPFQGQAQEVLSHLREHSILQSISEISYSIHKNHLLDLLSNSVNLIAKANPAQPPAKCACPQLSKIFASITDKAEEDGRAVKRGRLRLRRLAVQHTLQTGNEFKITQNKVAQLASQGSLLQQRVQQLSKYEVTLRQEVQASQLLIEQNKRQLEQLHRGAYLKQQELQKLIEAVSAAGAEHQRMLAAEERVKNFIKEQQANRIIKEVFEDYKQIEADIYQYAAYLQSNQLASDLYYEPHPFAAVQEQLQEGLRIVNGTIMQNRQQSLEEKCVAMRDFVLDAMGKFKRKDEQMGKVLEFRTKCILKFIGNMKKWLNNWEFKQEFLVGLRKQFAHNAELLQDKLQKLPSPKAIELKEIRDLTKKIVENYEMGNSFY